MLAGIFVAIHIDPEVIETLTTLFSAHFSIHTVIVGLYQNQQDDTY